MKSFVIIILLVILISKAACLDISNLTNGRQFIVDIQRKFADQVDSKNLHLMLDSSGYIPEGIFAGNFYSLGNFDQCYYKISGFSPKFGKYVGKYCLGTLDLDTVESLVNEVMGKSDSFRDQPMLRLPYSEHLGYQTGVCVPSFLSAPEISELFITFREDFCYSRATQATLSQGAFMTLAIIAIIATIATAATVYDIYLYSKNETSQSLLLCFSLFTNTRQLFSSYDTMHLSCLDGIKVLTMLWIILCHVLAIAMNAPLSNLYDYVRGTTDVSSMIVIGATVTVDTFLTVTGLVTSYKFLTSGKELQLCNLPLLYLSRFWRLFPSLALAVFFYKYVIIYTGIGPYWEMVNKTLVEGCNDGWINILLLISNYRKTEFDFCVPTAWYAAMDFQLFIFSPLIMTGLKRNNYFGLTIVASLIILSMAIPFKIFYENTILAGSSQFISDYYILTHARFGPYIIGILLGYIIYEKKKKNEITNQNQDITFSLLIFSASFSILLFCIFSGYPILHSKVYNPLVQAIYAALNRHAWSAALCAIIYLCVFGKLRFVNNFLSAAPFQFLSKLSYSIFLVHYAVITVDLYSRKERLEYTNWGIFNLLCGDYLVTIGCSVALYLMVEAPAIRIFKNLLL